MHLCRTFRGLQWMLAGGSPHCRICLSGSETTSHVISTCQGMAVERCRLLEEMKQLCNLTKNEIQFDKIMEDEEELCQFILDPTSLNLQSKVSLADPLLQNFYKLTRDFCFIIDKTRIGLLFQLKNYKI